MTLEGIEGCGKSLQLKLLEEELIRRQVPFISTFEPGATAFGQELRKVLLHAFGAPRRPIAELLLYLADRHQHLKETIEPALEEGQLVISDRYHDATLAYQGFARGIGVDWVDQLANVLEIRHPDLTFVFDVEVSLGLSRARSRDSRSQQQDYGRFEAEDLSFHERVREGYHFLARRWPDRVILVDGSGPPEAVSARVIELLLERGILREAQSTLAQRKI